MRFPVAAMILATLPSCGAAPSAYKKEEQIAERSYSQGRYVEAAEHHHRAADLAERKKDRDEAVYREATSFARAGKLEEARAVLSALVTRSPRGSRAARAAYDRALLTEALGKRAEAAAELDLVIGKYPDSGVAAPALRRRLRALDDAGTGTRSYLGALLGKLEKTELGEVLHYEYAAALEREGKLEAARDRYALVAKRYPYPRGALWDDALWHEADLEVRLGHPETAIAVLDRMLAEREDAHLAGSYERPRYAAARRRTAEIYRDVLHQPEKACAAYEKLWREHRTSRLRDDGAWNAARLALRMGQRARACDLLAALVKEAPDSRYASCAPKLCAEVMAPPGSGTCHEYLLSDGAQ